MALVSCNHRKTRRGRLVQNKLAKAFMDYQHNTKQKTTDVSVIEADMEKEDICENMEDMEKEDIIMLSVQCIVILSCTHHYLWQCMQCKAPVH